MVALVRRLGRRRLLVMSDQAISSLSNVVVAVLVARTVSPTMFGAFSVAMIGYQLSLGAVRATVGEPWLSAHSTDGARAWRRAAADLAHAAFAASVVAGLVIAAVAALLGGASSGGLLVLAAFFPLLGLQDALRHVAVVDRPHLAVSSDATWLVVASVAVVSVSSDAPAWFVLAWATGGAVGVLPLMFGLDVRWHKGSAVRWFRMHRGMASAFFGEFLTARATGHVVILALGGIAGLGAVGAVRAAQVFYGPLNTLYGGVYLALVPDGARQRGDPGRLARMMTNATVLVAGVAGAWMLVGIFLPDRWGAALFGATWSQAGDLMLAMGLAVLAGSLATGAFAGLRSLGEYTVSLRAQLYGVPPRLVLTLGGAALGAAGGFTVGFAVGNVVIAVIWWALFARVLHRGREPAVAIDGDRGEAGILSAGANQV